uniref:Uncharacterized protein n=1 Tax=Cucumis sativus TaxID=3659 RepID=A0A0A0LS84_CUCSA
MSYLRRAWMGAASVGVMESSYASNDQYFVFQSKLQQFQQNGEGKAAQELGARSSFHKYGKGGEGGRRGKEIHRAEDSLHKVMYLNCWTQS